MSSVKLDSLISEFPEEEGAARRLIDYLESGDKSNHSVRELTVQRLFDLVHPSSQRVLAKMLARLTEQGVLRRIVRVESEAHGGIGDFDSLSDIPLVMFDFRLGRDVEVRLDQVRLIYRVQMDQVG